MWLFVCVWGYGFVCVGGRVCGGVFGVCECVCFRVCVCGVVCVGVFV
jgi:hypothetical protein